jgi:hypothetical protein
MNVFPKRMEPAHWVICIAIALAIVCVILCLCCVVCTYIADDAAVEEAKKLNASTVERQRNVQQPLVRPPLNVSVSIAISPRKAGAPVAKSMPTMTPNNNYAPHPGHSNISAAKDPIRGSVVIDMEPAPRVDTNRNAQMRLPDAESHRIDNNAGVEYYLPNGQLIARRQSFAVSEPVQPVVRSSRGRSRRASRRSKSVRIVAPECCRTNRNNHAHVFSSSGTGYRQRSSSVNVPRSSRKFEFV